MREIVVEGKSIIINDSLGGSIYCESVFIFLDTFGSYFGWHERIEPLLLLDVQYIGKTEITEKYLRFKGHEKILKVSSEIIENRPNKEVLVKLLSFQPPYINGMTIPEIQSDDSRTDWYIGGGLIEKMPFDDWKSVVEGTLIKYFQPKYNIQYKDNYPSESHTSYKYFYDKNVRSIIVELHEEYMAHKTGNDKVPYTRTRLIQYALKFDDSGIHIMDNDNQNTDNFLF